MQAGDDPGYNYDKLLAVRNALEGVGHGFGSARFRARRKRAAEIQLTERQRPFDGA